MSCFASCLSDPDEVSAFFDSRAAKRYLSKLTPLERLVHREISAHPELVALRDQFQRVDESASGAIPPADLAPVLKLRPGAHCDLALDCFDANRDGEVSLFELVHGLARLAARGVADAPSFAFAACEGANERGFVTREEIAETFLKRRETREGFLYRTPAAKLDRAAFDHAAHTNYADILEPFERIWARLETLTGPAAETCAALKAQGHREFTLGLVLFPKPHDLLDPLFTNPLDLTESFRFLVKNTERVEAKMGHYSLGEPVTKSTNGP